MLVDTGGRAVGLRIVFTLGWREGIEDLVGSGELDRSRAIKVHHVDSGCINMAAVPFSIGGFFFFCYCLLGFF